MENRIEKRNKSRAGKSFLAGDVPLLHNASLECPYCGETVTLLVDGSAGNQSYFEDCEICCRPILLHCEFDSDGNLTSLNCAREDD